MRQSRTLNKTHTMTKSQKEFFRLPNKLDAMWELKYRVNYIIGKHNNGDDYNPAEMSYVEELIKTINGSRNVLQKFDKLNAELPNRVVHFDAKINNFLFDKTTNKAKAIIDLDTLMPGTVLSDIGDMIRTFSNTLGEESENIVEVKADIEIIQNIINGFLSSCEKFRIFMKIRLNVKLVSPIP